MSVPHPDLACRTVVELVTDYLEGELPPAERSRLEQHVVLCGGCEVYLRQSQVTLDALRALEAQPERAAVPDTVRTSALELFRKLKSEPGAAG